MPLRRHATRLVLAVVDDPAPTAPVFRDAPILIVPVAEAVGADIFAPHQGNQAGNRRRHEETAPVDRSEEHTSELQSLMRISYAVFCLKKKTTTDQNKI